MNSIITKIFYGDLRCEKKMMKNESVKESIEKFSVAYELLDDALNEKQKKLLSELYDEKYVVWTQRSVYIISKKVSRREFIWGWNYAHARGNKYGSLRRLFIVHKKFTSSRKNA